MAASSRQALRGKEKALPSKFGQPLGPLGPQVKAVLDSASAMIASMLRHRLRLRRITTFEELAEFAATRSAYIAQTSLYGYLKTRMGTQFRVYFEDELFSREIHSAALKLYVSCLSDLTVHSVGLLYERAALTEEGASELATELYAAAIPLGVQERDRVLLSSDAHAEFRRRIEQLRWDAEFCGLAAFAGSARDLVRYAPVVDEFKELDNEIVTNSIRFRWRNVREQLRDRLYAEEVVGSFNRP